MPSLRAWTFWDPRLVQTKARALADAEYELKKVQKKNLDLWMENDRLHRRLMEVEEDLIKAQEDVAAFETGLRIGVIVYPKDPDPRLAASPTHPGTMIGRGSNGTRGAD